jgi:YYY domain-containing protein
MIDASTRLDARSNQNTGTRSLQGIVSRSDALILILLILTMLLGSYFRFMGNNWNDWISWHPDERYLTYNIASKIGGALVPPQIDCSVTNEQGISVCAGNPGAQERHDRQQECLARNPDTGGRGGYFDTDCSPYNPENIAYTNFAYGTLPVFSAVALGELAEDITGDTWTDALHIALVWRAMNAAGDVIVIFLTFLIGLRLHNKWTGLVAAMLYAFAVLPIQIVHFATTDAMTVVFVTLGLFFAVRAQDTGKWWDYGAFGLALGAAVACRVNVAPLAGIIAIVGLIRTLPVFEDGLAWEERGRLLLANVGGVVLAAIASLLVFRVLNPYAFEGPGFFGFMIDDRFLTSLEVSRGNVSGTAESPPNWQWVNRTPYLFAWQNMVLWGMGVALGLTGWIAWGWSLWKLLRGREGGLRNITLITWVGGYFAFTGGLWVMVVRYYLPLYPALALLAAWLLVHLVQRARALDVAWRKVAAWSLLVGVTGFTFLWALMFTNIYRNQATFVQGSYWVLENVPGDFYTRLDGAPEDAPLITADFGNGAAPLGTPTEDHFLHEASRLFADRDFPNQTTFIAPDDGTISSFTAYRLAGVQTVVDPITQRSGPSIDPSGRTVTLGLQDQTTGEVLDTTQINGSFDAPEHPLGQSHQFVFDEPVPVEAGRTYTLTVTVEGGPMIVSGATMSTELPWDEAFPAKVCTLPYDMTLADNPSSGMFSVSECNGVYSWQNQVNIYNLDIQTEDDLAKQQRLVTILDQLDYIAIQTNRRYDSQSRIESRWPLTNTYYDALFSGELGFELEAMFQETFEVGPLKVSDQYLPTYDAPAWLNEFEADEAFHVYDHPVVFIFKKTDDYSPANTQAILGGVPLTRAGTVMRSYNNPTITDVTVIDSLTADLTPTQLTFTDEMQDIQEDGGTWAERFDSDSPINTNQVLAVTVWWLTIIVFGLVVWPLLFVAFPALADRGYGMAKFTGMFLVAWIAWLLGVLRLRTWSGMGILFILVVLAVVGIVICWRQRGVLLAYIRSRWKLLLTIEALAAVLYLAWIGVRLTNPDLWHDAYEGEKPMDFAYFNAVLRSTIFPPIDPWYAGGYINYYYFGFVIVGAPTLLLGVIPSIAYNLILPTLYSAVGMAAFSLAFSMASAWRRNHDTSEGNKRRVPVGNPWAAGVMALLLAVVLGNLGTPKEFLTGVAQLGGYEVRTGIEQEYYQDKVQDYIQINGRMPDDVIQQQFRFEAQDEATDAGLLEQVSYELEGTGELVSGIFSGFGRMLSGEQLPVNANRWFWGPTRLIAELKSPSVDGAINEMPIFTFVYGDLHAHMISMPMQIFVMAFIFNELMIAGRERRSMWMRLVALVLGALTVGMFQATNTWEWPTFMILGVLGLGYAWWLNWERLSRWSILSMFGRVGGFVVLTYLLALPYTYWFASGLTEFKQWEGLKTPLWTYLTIHGVFIFFIGSLLVWETGRWLRSVRVRQLHGRFYWLQGIGVLALLTLLAVVVLYVMSYRVQIVVLPMVVWIGVVFFRPGQSRVMQFALVLAGLALSITLGTEFITLANDNGRQNTVFKFYLQAWLLLSVAGGVGFAWVLTNSMRWRSRLALPWYTLGGLLIFIAALYPITAIQGRAQFRLAPDMPLTLDGAAYMQYLDSYWEPGLNPQDYISLEPDYEVIRWLQENVEGSPVVMEGTSELINYFYGGRISMHTGLPTVVGWDYHQRQQRSLRFMAERVDQRLANVNAFYTTTNIDDAAEILRYYNVEYVILSPFELSRYTEYTPETGEALSLAWLEKFDRMEQLGMLATTSFEGEAVIYQVNQAALKARLRELAAAGATELTNFTE